MRNQQLKESLLGWGGYEDKQDKIYLENQVVYCRGNRQSSTSTIRGIYSQWEATVGGTTYTCYTEYREPNLGDPVYIDGVVAAGRVIGYDSLSDTISIFPPASANFPAYTTSYSNVSSVEVKQFTMPSTTESVYLINLDGTQSDRKFTITIDYNDTTANEKFFFDKRTQCLVRTAFQEYAVDSYASSGVGTLKQIVFDTFDPNTGLSLDHHVIFACSNQFLGKDCRKENIAQGFYSFYCNGIVRKATVNDDGFAHIPVVFSYSPRHRKVFAIEVGQVLDIQNPIGSASTSTKDMFFGIYNQSTNLDALDDMVASFYVPNYLGDTSDNVDERFCYIDLDLETNPYSMVPTTLTFNTNVPGNVQYTKELYPDFPSTTTSALFGNANSIINKAVFYNYAIDNHIPTLQFFTKTYSVATDNLTMPDVNMCSGMYYSILYPSLSTSGWVGEMNHVTDTVAKLLFTASQLSTPVTNTSLYPRLLSGTKYINKTVEIYNAGEVCTLSGRTYYKEYSDPCYAAILVDSTYAVPVLVGLTEESVTAYNSDNTTPHYTGYLDYNEQRWYYGLCEDWVSTTGLSITNTMDLPIIYLDLHNNSNDINALYVIKASDSTLYSSSILIKDYYNDGTEQLVYKLHLKNNFVEIPLVDSVSGDPITYVQQEQTEIPTAEEHLVLTSTNPNSVSASTLPRYINIVSLAQDNQNLQLTYVSDSLDCNSNTEYLADNTTTGSGSIGGFAIPPVAIADGETTPVPPQIDQHYYAWKQVSGNITTFIFTNSLDAAEVVGSPYFFKDAANHFYREVEQPSTIISSLTSTYVTTRSGQEYTRISEYDWDYEEATTSYVPSYLNAWGA